MITPLDARPHRSHVYNSSTVALSWAASSLLHIRRAGSEHKSHSTLIRAKAIMPRGASSRTHSKEPRYVKQANTLTWRARGKLGILTPRGLPGPLRIRFDATINPGELYWMVVQTATITLERTRAKRRSSLSTARDLSIGNFYPPRASLTLKSDLRLEPTFVMIHGREIGHPSLTLDFGFALMPSITFYRRGSTGPVTTIGLNLVTYGRIFR